MKNFLVLAITLLALQLEAQVKHDYVWLFGYEPDDPHPKIGGSKLDFNIYPYDTSRFDIPFRFKAISMISDSGGALQFYTNGCQIANAAHQIMANGDDLNPGLEHEVYCAFGYPLEQGVLTLPWPGNKNRYVIIHMQFEGEDGEFNLLYSVIKMDTMNNLGAVTIKNQSLLFNEKVCDILTAVKHANGRDWWIVLPKTRSNLFLTWLLTPEGFTGPYEQPHGDDWDYRYYLNHGVFSPDGTTYVRASPSNGLRISRFDRCTGYFTLPLNIPFEIEASVSGVAISPNSRLLYLSTGFHLWQYDLYAADIGSSATLIDIFDGYQSPFNTTFYQPMLAPDGKIYMTCTNGNDVLHIIHRPDERGADCRFEQHGLRIP
ncbi:MAG: hypothetical protein SFV22_20730, partial [Saprospiraceae bacterium]|nr:hypothetical protein [Saprospiraceae bacterium]